MGNLMNLLASRERVALFLERAELLRTSRAVSWIDATKITIRAGSSQEPTADVVAPDEEATLAYFARIRHFDTQRTDLYVPDFFPNLHAGASARRAQVIAHVREAHADLGRRGNDWPKIVLGDGATPRSVWELWTYSQVLHTDPVKRATWADLQAYEQGMAKFIAYAYAGDLYHLVTVVEAMIRDPELDDRGVRMRVLATRAEYAGVPGVEQFRAARVSLPDASPESTDG
jgi:hypothetical protein